MARFYALRGGWRSLLVLCFLAGLYVTTLSLAAEDKTSALPLSAEETLKLGERIYREGILPSGKQLTATVLGNLPTEGMQVSCVGCHLRSGLGSVEAGELTLPINGKNLFVPYSGFPLVGREGGMDEEMQYKRTYRYLLKRYGGPPSRPAYTDESLAAAIRDGKDSAGRVLDPFMPRFALDDHDMAILTTYLKSLSAEPSSGVTETTMRLATVITPEVSPKERDEMLQKLDEFVQFHNVMAPRVLSDFRSLSLARWELRGPPETWRAQLDEYYRKEPVFALVGGITTGEWRPIHEFSEQRRIPCLFPVTDFPVVTDRDSYTFYFSKGFYQEGEEAAHYLARLEKLAPDAHIVQVYQDTREGRAFAAGFREAWNTSSRPPVVDKAIQAGKAVTAKALQALADHDRPTVMLLWLGPDSLSALRSVVGRKNHPETFFLSASLLKNRLLALPESIRDSTLITYPYWMPQPADMPMKYRKPRFEETPGKETPLAITGRHVAYKMTTLTHILGDVLSQIRKNFYRDYILDRVSMIQVGGTMGISDDSPYDHISFGPGQHYASKGCYIVQLSRGPNPMLVKKNEWVTQ